MSETKSAARPTVVRVRGLPRTDLSTAEATIRKAITDNSSGQSLEYRVSVVPSCDQAGELAALLDFPTGLPDFLSSLKTDPLSSYEVPRDDEDDDDLVFDRHFHGFTQLYDVAEENIQADIIAICGIDGHAYGSWQGRGHTRRMWLRHFLRKDLPSCRVMTYGYNAKLATYSFATADDYSVRLLEDLRRVRTGKAQIRPIIFITHSFGGLILASSIIKTFFMNETDHPALTSLHRATYGILFFAVPHRGLDVEDMSRIMGEEKHPRTGLLNHINVDSAQLRYQLGPLKDILYHCKVISYYETMQTHRLRRTENGEWERSGENFTSLERDSAVLQLPRQIETPIPMHCDHSAIVKFNNKSDDGYASAVSYLQEFVKQAPLIVSQRFQSMAYSSFQSSFHSESTLAVSSQDIDVGSQGPTDDTQEPTSPAPQSAAEAKASRTSEAENLTASYDAAFKLATEGKHADAEAKFLEVLAGRQKELGPDHSDTLKTMFEIGRARHNQLKSTEALEIYTQLLDIRKKVLGKDHADTLQTIHNIGLAQFQQKNYNEALVTFSDALAARKRTLGEDHAKTLYTMFEIGRTHQELKQNAEAVNIYRETLGGRMRTLGADHVDTMQTMHNIGLMEYQQGQHTEALATFSTVLASRIRVLGKDSVATLYTMFEIGRTHYALKQYVEAGDMWSQTLEGRTRIIGPDKPDTLAAKHNLALAYYSQGDYTEALSLHTQVLADRERLLGQSHADTLNSMHEVGRTHRQLNQYEKAIALYTKCLEGREKTLGFDNLATLITTGNLAGTYALNNNLAEAQSMYIRYITGRDKVFGVDHAGTLWAVHALGQVYERDGKLEEAEATFARAVVARRKAFGKDSDQYRESKSAHDAFVHGNLGRGEDNDQYNALRSAHDAMAAKDLVRRGRAWFAEKFQ